MSMSALQVKDLHAWYGESYILHSVNLAVDRDEVIMLLGCNGVGRTTTLHAIMDLVSTYKSSIAVYDADGQGVETINLPTHKITRCGIGYCLEERGIFSSLSCGESLMLPPVLKDQAVRTGNASMSIDGIYEILPNLAEHHQNQGTYLSGGEQRMLTVGCALRTGANLLLFDEISEGLAPVVVQAPARMILVLKRRGYTVVMVERNSRFVAPLTDWFYVMEHGCIVERFEAVQLQDRMPVLHELLSV